MISRTRRGLLALVTLSPGLAVTGDANAHVGLVPDRIETAGNTTITVVAPNEHEHSEPMVGLTLSLPDGMTVVDDATRGWRFDLERGLATWSNNNAGKSSPSEFRLRAVGPPKSGDHELAAAQLYADGHADRWAVPFSVVEPPPGQNLAAAAVVAALGIALVTAIVLLKNNPRRSSDRT